MRFRTPFRPAWARCRRLFCLSLCGALLAVCGCGGGGLQVGASTPAPPRTVPVIIVDKQDLVQTIEMPGTVEGFETADLYAKVGGYLDQILVDIGDRVEQGEVLARLSIPELHQELQGKRAAVISAQAKVSQAEAAVLQTQAGVTSAVAAVEEAETHRDEKQAQLQYRQAAYERTNELVQRGSLLAKMLDEAHYQSDAAAAALKSVQASVRAASARLQAAQANVVKAERDRDSAIAMVAVAEAQGARTESMLAYSVIKAPFSGLVTKRTVDPGAFIQPAEGNSAAQPLLTISRTNVVRVRLDLPMKQVRWLDRGDEAVLNRIVVLPGERFTGTVARFSPSLDRTSRMMHVEIDLENPAHRLLPGYYGYVRLFLAEFPQTPVIPSSALMTDQEGAFVYVVETDTVTRRNVVTSYRDGTIVGIASGLMGGEQVVQAGGGQLRDGQKVTPVVADEG